MMNLNNPGDKLLELKETARQEGADEAVLIPAGEIIVDERVRLKCLVPRCEDYGRNLMCPPNLPSVDEFRRVLERYRWGLIVQVKGNTSSYSGGNPEKDIVFRHANRLHQLVNELERRFMGKGYTLAAGFIGGSCMLCKECVGQSSDKPCRYPFKARPSMEAMGINVGATLAKVGLGLASFPVSGEVVWTGLILID